MCYQWRLIFPQSVEQLLIRFVPDFNFAPDDPAYSLLVGDSVLPTQENRLAPSRVVHRTVDPEVPTNHAPAEEGGDGETDPDKIITNARPATRSDGLLTTAELVDLYATPARSIYDEGLLKHRGSTNKVVTYGDRICLQPSRRGANEPEWTSYTHYWKTVLGTIFCIMMACETRTC
jgi:RNA exonuclease NGL2